MKEIKEREMRRSHMREIKGGLVNFLSVAADSGAMYDGSCPFLALEPVKARDERETGGAVITLFMIYDSLFIIYDLHFICCYKWE